MSDELLEIAKEQGKHEAEIDNLEEKLEEQEEKLEEQEEKLEEQEEKLEKIDDSQWNMYEGLRAEIEKIREDVNILFQTIATMTEEEEPEEEEPEEEEPEETIIEEVTESEEAKQKVRKFYGLI